MNNDAKSFIVRIWIESSSDDEPSPTWREVIEHVGSSDRKHFHELGTITEFISEKTGLNNPTATTAWWQSARNWIRNELRKWLPNLQ